MQGLEDFEEAKANELEMKALEDLINKTTNKVSDHYKLFEYVSKNNPEQVIRYCRSASIEPLWSSEKNNLAKD